MDPAPIGSPGSPILTGTIEIPDHQLYGTISLSRLIDPGANPSFAVKAQIEPKPGTSGPAILSIGAPRVCDAVNCDVRPLSGSVLKAGPADYVFLIPDGSGYALLSGLRDRTWLTLPIVFANGRRGEVGVSLSGTTRQAIGDWEHRCCGLVPLLPTRLDAPGTAPVLHGLPAGTRAAIPAAPPAPARSADLGTVTIKDSAHLTMSTGSLSQSDGTAIWTLSITPSGSRRPGSADLRAEVEIPAAGIHLSLRAGVDDQPEDRGDVVLDVTAATTNPLMLGQLASLTMEQVPQQDGAASLYTEKVLAAAPTSFRAVVKVPTAGPVGPDIRIVLGDLSGRFGTLSIPIGEAVGDHLRDDARANATLAD